jgi:hypothetical protein
VKYIFVIPLMLLMVALAAMLPVRPVYKELARAMMKGRIDKHLRRETSEHIEVLVASEDIPAKAWERKDEFRMGGLMYDVVGTSYKEGKKYYRCLHDEVEAKAERAADELVSDMGSMNPHTPQGKLAKSLADWLSGLYFEPTTIYQQRTVAVVKPAYGVAPMTRVREPFVGCMLQPPDA